MKVSIAHKPLANALTWVAKAISSRPNNEVLRGIKLTATDDGTLTLFGTDFDVWLSTSVEADVAEPGTVIVPAAFVRDIISALSGKEVDLWVEGAALLIKAGRSQYRAPIFPAHEYPLEPDFPAPVGTVGSDHLRQLVKTVRFPIDDRSPHDFLRGICFEGDGDDLRAIGMQAAVLSTMTAPWSHQGDFSCHATSSWVDLATSSLTGAVTVGYEDHLLGFKDDTRMAVVRCIAQDFIGWRQAIPESFAFTARVDTADLVAAIKRAALATAADGAAEKPIWFSVKHDHLEITSGTESDETGIEVIDTVADGELKTGFFAGYLAGLLANVHSDMVTLSFQSDRRRPLVITPDNHPSLHAITPRLPHK